LRFAFNPARFSKSVPDFCAVMQKELLELQQSCSICAYCRRIGKASGPIRTPRTKD